MEVKRQHVMHRQRSISANPIIDDRYLNTAEIQEFNNYPSSNLLILKLQIYENTICIAKIPVNY